MLKEPTYYKASYRQAKNPVKEGPKPVNNFQYLEDLTYDDLFLTGTRAFHRKDSPLERAADEVMRKKYAKLVGLWIEGVDKREPDLGYEVYLAGLSEIVRLGVNNHPQELIALWPNLKERVDVLLANLRLSHNSFARKKYHYDDIIVDALIEQQELEMMRHG